MEITEVDYLDALLSHTHRTNATDLHICAGQRPVVRVNGKLELVENTPLVTPEIINGVIGRLLDGRRMEKLNRERVLDFSFSKSGIGRFRVNIYSQRGTFAIAMRMLQFDAPEFAGLGLPASVERFASKTKGLFLATGATGSGKSTTLASLLNVINRKYRYHIITIEDPIEYLYQHDQSLLTQREIGEDADSFSHALRSALREDPDVIMVGEMRDPETISIALTAAETGHLVFSTLHTAGAAKTIDRILDAFPPSQQAQIRSQLATVLDGAVSQTLIPRTDGRGLAVACEVMIVNPAIRNLIREGKHYQIGNVLQTGSSKGMLTLEKSLADLCARGVISRENAFLYAQDQTLLEKHLQ
jgi:twitching motility protein PilT